jgi:hypothetical protein
VMQGHFGYQNAGKKTYETYPESKSQLSIPAAQEAPARRCLMSREGYIRQIASSHSLLISLSFCLEMSMKIKNPKFVILS